MNFNFFQQNSSFSLVLLLVILIALVSYTAAAVQSGDRYKPWPISRYFYWTIGIVCTAAAVTGPLAARAHTDFTAHMVGHLLLGMLSPLLLTLAAPITLFLKTINVKFARRLTYILKSQPLRMISHPISAALLNVGGLWFLYTTDLYMAMHNNPILYFLIHMHIWLAGWLFTLSIIYIEPTPHRHSFLLRSCVFVTAFAAHGILSKYIYAHPPAGVPSEQAKIGGMLMYYGGDIIEIAIILIFCNQWFRKSRTVQKLVNTSRRQAPSPQ